jgi:DNA-binding NarL/FixJ family response regulator
VIEAAAGSVSTHGLGPRHRSLAHLATAGTSFYSVSDVPDDGAGHIAVVLGCFDALLGLGLKQLLSEDRDLQVLGVDMDRAVLQHAVESLAPHVAILDEAAVRELSVLGSLRVARPTTGIVVLAHHPTVSYATSLMADGASCVAKDISAAGVLAAVHIAADGRRVFADVDGHMVERSRPATSASLTPREIEVLEYLSRGQSHAEIAHALQVGVETVRTHSAHIRSKLGVRSKRELIGLTIPLQGETGPSRQTRQRAGLSHSSPKDHLFRW